MTARNKMIVENIIPVLTVTNLDNSIKFYTETLSFGLDWGGEAESHLCSLSRNKCRIMLSESATKSPGRVWIGLTDDSLFQHCIDSGMRIVQAPTNQPWAYEMQVLDLDDNILWLGTERKTP